jgi:hypothetical protein
VSGSGTFDATASIHASWNVGEIVPPARPFCDNGIVTCTISVDLNGRGHADDTKSEGAGWCGCCANGSSYDVANLNGNLSGTVTGTISVDVGWLGHGELVVQGSACVSGRISKGKNCAGPVDYASGGWQLSASARGNVCLGSGWFEYCRDFSAGPWTVGPGCE